MAEAIFLNREEVPVQPLYHDPVHDFGFMRFDPRKLQVAGGGGWWWWGGGGALLVGGCATSAALAAPPTCKPAPLHRSPAPFPPL